MVAFVNNILILGYGNPSRGDDALGPMLVEQLEQLKRRNHWAHIELLVEYQLQIENVLDLIGRDLVLLIDANVSCAAPYVIEQCPMLHDQSCSSHALSPAALLFIYRQSQGVAPPPCYVLNIRGYQFELGQDLSLPAQQNLHAANAFAEQFCHDAIDRDALDNLQCHILTQYYA